MASNVEDITINYEEEGLQVVKELDKVVLTKGAWSTILFMYQEWDKRKEAYSDNRFSIRRYRKLHGNYQQQSKFNISSKDQAKKIIDALGQWVK